MPIIRPPRPSRLLVVGIVLGLCACSTSASGGATPSTASPSPTPTTSSPSPSSEPAPSATGSVQRLDGQAVLHQVEILASDIGPREATSAGFKEAATLVAGTLLEYGFRVRRQDVPVPAGQSAGGPVPAGTTQNVAALPQGFAYDEPFRMVVAHVDTVPGSPGAEDDASGVGVLLELARTVSTFAPHVPVVFVALGGEEPRGTGAGEQLFGSDRLLASLTPAQRARLVGLVSLDGVGVRSSAVPVCSSASGAANPVAEQLAAAATRVDVRVRRCEDQTSAHWPFEQAGLPAARVGGTDYPEQHGDADVPSVVSAPQLGRVGTLVLAWLQAPAP